MWLWAYNVYFASGPSEFESYFIGMLMISAKEVVDSGQSSRNSGWIYKKSETSNAVFSKAVSCMFSMQIWGDYLGLGDVGKQMMNVGKV